MFLAEQAVKYNITGKLRVANMFGNKSDGKLLSFIERFCTRVYFLC